MGKAYVTINGTNLLTTYAMELMTKKIGEAVPDIKIIEVPGRPGGLDATLALNGKVNYLYRPIEMVFHIRDITEEDFDTLCSTLSAKFNGTLSKVVFSTDPDWYYKGRFKIDKERTNAVTATITMTCEKAFPYKLETFSVTGESSSSLWVNCIGKDYNGPVTANASAAVSITANSKTYSLAAGDNELPEVILSKGSNQVRISGAATVTFTYERGIL